MDEHACATLLLCGQVAKLAMLLPPNSLRAEVSAEGRMATEMNRVSRWQAS